MILVDSSAWIEYLRETGSGVNDRVRELIGSGAPLTTSEPVNMEILAGARDRVQLRALDYFLRGFPLMQFDSVVDFDAAARVYRLCRRHGVTVRSVIDCMIASVAMRHRAAILAHDTDFSLMAGVVALELDPATPTIE